MSNFSLTVSPFQSEEFLNRPNLSQEEADRAAMGWQDRLQVYEGRTDEGSLKTRKKVVESLRSYQSFKQKSGLPAFSHEKKAIATEMSKSAAKNLDGWNDLLSDEGFGSALESRKLSDQFNRAVEISGDEESVKAEFRRRIFLKEIGGDDDEVTQARVSKGIMGIEDSSDEPFLNAAKNWVSSKRETRDIRRSAAEAGIKAFLEGKRGKEFVKLHSEFKKKDPALAEIFAAGFERSRSETGPAAAVARMFIKEINEGKKTGGNSVGSILSLYRSGKREQFLQSVSFLADQQEGGIEGFFSKFAESVHEGLAKTSGDLLAFSKRTTEVEGQLEKSGKVVVFRKGKSLLGGNEGGEVLLGGGTGTVEDHPDLYRFATQEEVDKLLEREAHNKAAVKLLTDIKDLRPLLKEVKASAKGILGDVEQGVYDFGQSIPYTAMAVVPGGVLGTWTAMAEDNTQQLIKAGYDEETAKNVGAGVAVPMAGIEMLQGRTVMNIVPGGKSLLQKMRGGILKKAITAVGAEFTQETLQDAMLPLATEIMEEISKEVPELNQWDDFTVMDKRRFFAVLPLALLGAAGGQVQEKVQEGDIKDILSDEDILLMDGFSKEEASEVSFMAKTQPAKALERFREIHNSKTAEEREALGSEAMKELQERDDVASLEVLPTVTPAEEGGYRVNYKDGSPDNFADTEQEAQIMADQWMREDSANNLEAVKGLISHFEERAEGDNTVKHSPEKELTLSDVERLGAASDVELKKAVAVYHAQKGESAPKLIDLENYRSEGMVKLKSRLAGFSVKIAKGANPLTVAEEFSEGFLRMMEAQGEISFDEVKGLLDEFGDISGLEMTQGYDVDPERAVIEGFSKFAKAYLLQDGQSKSLPEETRNWISKAWRILENPDSLPPKLRAVADLFAKLFKTVFSVAREISAVRKDANGLNPDLESLALRALGLDEKGYGERMEEQYRKEIMEELYDPAEELSAQVKGKLPRPSDPAANGYEGELSAIFDRFKKRTKNKKGKTVETTIGAVQLFAKKGEGIPLDQLRANLNEQGFRFDTVGELLDAVEESQRGEKQWPVGVGEEFSGEQTFSISPIEITLPPYQETGAKLKKKLLSEVGSTVTNSLTGWDVGFYSDGARHVVNQLNGEQRKMLPHFKELFESSVWMGRRKHRDSEKARGIRWQHLFYAPAVSDGKMTIARFLINETYQGERLLDMKSTEFKAGSLQSEERAPIPSVDRLTVRELEAQVKEAWPKDEVRLQQPRNDRRDNSTFSITPTQDASYLSAVESGDMETAQAMVDQAAKAAGYGVKAHHVTNEKFDRFDPEKAAMGGVFWFTENREKIASDETGAGLRPGKEKIVLDVYLKAENPAGWDDYEKLGLGEIEERGFDSVKLDDDFIIFNSKQAKLSDPVTYDESGKLIPLSKRFNERDDRITHSISPTDQRENTQEAIDRLFTGPSGMVETGRKMRTKLSDLRDRFESKMFGKHLQGVDTREIETLNALMQLNAIASVLPREVRHVVGSPVSLVAVKSQKAREKQVITRLEKIALALEGFIQKGYRQDIRKLIDKSSATTDKATRRKKSKIGVIGHAVTDAAIEAMVMNPLEASTRADSIRAEFDLLENPSLDQMDEAEGRAMAFELFSDYENADSARLERAIEFLETNYAENRKEWLQKLADRKEFRESKVASLREAIGTTDFTGFSEITKSNKDGSPVKQFGQELASFYQMMDFIAEKTDDAALRAVVKEASDSFRHARNDFGDNLDARQDEIFNKVGEILGITKGPNITARVNGELVRLSKPESVNATHIVGRKIEEISVPLDRVDFILRKESNKVGDIIFTEADVDALQQSHDRFLDLPTAAQNRRKKITFQRVVSAGVRKPLGFLSQLDIAKEWLALQQQDAKAKYEKGGWDAQTLRELEREMLPETMELAKFMQGYLREMTPEVDSVHREEYGLALASVENYFPLLFNVVGNDTEISMDGNNISVSARKGSFLKSRISHAAMPKQANALAVLQGHIASVEFWKTHAPVLRQWGGVLKDQKLQHAFQAKMGPEFTTSLNNWLKMIEANGRDQALVNLVSDRAVRKLQGGLALSVLGLRLRTILVNATAALNVTFQVPLTQLIKGLRPEVFGDVATLAKSSTFQRRLRSGGSYEATLALEQRVGGGLVATTLRRAAQLGMQPINFVDTLTNLTTALAYRARVVDNRKAGMSEEDAQADALDHVDEIITRVAQPTDMLSRSLFENKRKGGIGGLLFLFASEARKNTSVMGLAARKLATGKGVQSRGMASQQLLIGTILYGGFGYVIKSFVEALVKEGDDDEEDFEGRFMAKMTDEKAISHAIATEHLRGIPLLGEGWSAIAAKAINETDLEGEKVKVFDSSNNPLMRTYRGVNSAIKATEAENADELTDNLIDAVQGIAGLLPETAVFSQVGNIAEDSLGFFRNTMGGSLSEEEAINKMESRFRKKKEAIMKLEREAYKEAQGREKRKISRRREASLKEALSDFLAEMSPERQKTFLKRAEEKKLLTQEIMESLK